MQYTIKGEQYTEVRAYNAGIAGSKFAGRTVFILRKNSDGSMWRALGKRVAHNSTLIPHTGD